MGAELKSLELKRFTKLSLALREIFINIRVKSQISY